LYHTKEKRISEWRAALEIVISFVASNTPGLPLPIFLLWLAHTHVCVALSLSRLFLSRSPKPKLSIAFRYEHVKPTIDGVFEGVLDRFNGITIDSVAEACEECTFDEKLASEFLRSI
jgi:hypothetical protein